MTETSLIILGVALVTVSSVIAYFVWVVVPRAMNASKTSDQTAVVVAEKTDDQSVVTATVTATTIEATATEDVKTIDEVTLANQLVNGAGTGPKPE